MRNTPPSNISTWTGHKEKGRVQFENEEYEEALASYRAALSPEYGCPTAERQILLSNVVACRLKMGGPAQASAAVEEAKQCVALNENWAKGHIRLASAYVELGGHSNDACNSLQRAISIEPGNATARQMLMRELRRDKQTPSNDPPAPEQEEDRQPQQEAGDISNGGGVEDTTVSWTDRLNFHYTQGVALYNMQSEDIKTLLKVFLGLLALYVAFGGRFGLESLIGGGTPQNLGNYEAGNVYDRYHRQNNAEVAEDDARSYSSGKYRGQHDPPTVETPPQRSVKSAEGESLWYSSGKYTGSREASTVETHPPERSAGLEGESPWYSSGRYTGSRDGPSSTETRRHERSVDAEGEFYRSGEYSDASPSSSHDTPPQRTSSNREAPWYSDANYGGSSSSRSFHFPDLFDGSPQSLFVVLALAYLCYKAGINPLHVLMMMNMMGGRRRGGRRMYGMGGMGYGAARPGAGVRY